MRLLITTDTVGGVWQFAQELVKGLLEAGDSVALVSFGRLPSVAQVTDCERLLRRWGERFCYRASAVSLEWMQDNRRCFEEGVPLLEQVAEHFDAELLHVNQFCYGAAKLDIPKIVTAHSDVLSWARACRGGVLEDSVWLRQYRALVQQGLDAADAVTAPTNWMLRAVANEFRLPQRQVVIANGRSIPTYDTGPRMIRGVTAGRLWDEAKNVTLLDTVRSPMPLILAGEADYDGSQGVSMSGVELRGALPEQEIFDLFASSVVYVCTSRYEPFGLAPLEAALCGCAVAARDIDSLREVWQDAALYFGDAEELSALLTRLTKQPQLLREAQRQAGEQARRYTRQHLVEGYRSLYATMLEKEYAHVA
jgi:glycogen synthase